MKREYVTPTVEKIEFDYAEQVVVASDRPIGEFYKDGYNTCRCGDTSS